MPFRRTAFWAVALVAVPLAASGCNRAADDGGGNGTSGAGSLLYVLQPDDVDLAAIASSRFGTLVIEPSRSGAAADELTAGEVAELRSAGPCGVRTVLAYLSVGEAESYRDYWNPQWIDADGEPRPGVAPSWLGPENPAFPGNYKVRYWDSAWQALIRGTPDGPNRTPFDRILAAGYDGVYLDIIDAYEFWSDTENGAELTRTEARRRMIDWVSDLADYAHRVAGRADFQIVPQNAATIIFDDDEKLDALGERYLGIVAGIGVEDLYYDETAPQSEQETAGQLRALHEYRDRGRFVLSTDYVIAAAGNEAGSISRAADFVARSRAEGFIPYAAISDRNLDEVVTLDTDAWGFEQPASCPQ